MIEGIKFAHERDVKVYVTANILAHNYDLDGAREYFKELDVIKPDAVIISDPGNVHNCQGRTSRYRYSYKHTG